MVAPFTTQGSVSETDCPAALTNDNGAGATQLNVSSGKAVVDVVMPAISGAMMAEPFTIPWPLPALVFRHTACVTEAEARSAPAVINFRSRRPAPGVMRGVAKRTGVVIGRTPCKRCGYTPSLLQRHAVPVAARCSPSRWSPSVWPFRTPCRRVH